jgi:hypothetical protein
MEKTETIKELNAAAECSSQASAADQRLLPIKLA